jgi:hypothetical protein
MILISCALITTDERNILCTYDCTCILCSAATLENVYMEKILFITMLYLYYDKFYILGVNLTLYGLTECK